MSVIMKKNPHSVREPAGLEWRLFKKLPRLTLLGLAVLGLAWGVLKAWPVEADASYITHRMQTFEYALIGLAIFHLTMVFTVALGCVIVMIMKGPQYTSDSYDLQDAERPPQDRSDADPAAKS